MIGENPTGYVWAAFGAAAALLAFIEIGKDYK